MKIIIGLLVLVIAILVGGLLFDDAKPQASDVAETAMLPPISEDMQEPSLPDHASREETRRFSASLREQISGIETSASVAVAALHDQVEILASELDEEYFSAAALWEQVKGTTLRLALEELVLIEKDYEKLQSKHDEEREALQSRIAELEQRFVVESTARLTLEESLREIQETWEAQEQQIEQQYSTERQALLHSLATAKAERDELAHRLEEMTPEMVQMQEELALRSAEPDHDATSVHDAAEMETIRDQLAVAQSTIQALRTELTEERDRYDDLLEWAREQMTALNRRIAELAARIANE